MTLHQEKKKKPHTNKKNKAEVVKIIIGIDGINKSSLQVILVSPWQVFSEIWDNMEAVDVGSQLLNAQSQTQLIKGSLGHKAFYKQTLSHYHKAVFMTRF